jgi:hypothetical protein
MKNWFSFERHFPGLTGRIRSAAASKGYATMMRQHDEVIALTKNLSQEQKREITDYIEAGKDFSPGVTDSAGRELNDIKADVIQRFRDMAAEDVAIGHRESDKMLDDGTYVYHYFPKAYKTTAYQKQVNDWRAARRSALRSPGGTNVNKTILDAEAKGLKPVHEIDKILLAKHADVNRTSVKHWFKTEVLNSYGTFVPKEARYSFRGDMQRVSDDLLTPQMKKRMEDEEGAWYLPKDIHNTFKTLSDMQKINDPSTRAALRWLDTANRGFKFAQTVPNPGYHVRNMMSDFMFSFLDHGDPGDYLSVAKGWRDLRQWGKVGNIAAKAPSYKTDGGVKILFDDLFKEYKNRIGTGSFYPTDIPRGIMGAKTKIGGKLRRGAEMREDYGRMAHFKSAFDQEFKKIRAGRSLQGQALEDAKKEAFNSAADRVNKFNIDYSALTPTEQKFVKRAIPFYTFMRKATPLMMEQMATNPGRVLLPTKIGAALQTMLGVSPGMAPFSGFPIPEYMQEPGMTRLNNEAEPSFLTWGWGPQGILPSAVGQSRDPGTAARTALLARLNPGLRLPFEIARGRKYFGNKPIKSSADAILEEVNPFNRYAPFMNSGAITEKSGATLAEQAASLAGVPYYRATEKRQIGAAKFQTEKAKAQLGKINKVLTDKGYEFQTTTRQGQKIYRIVDRVNGKVLFESGDPSKTRQYANKLYT